MRAIILVIVSLVASPVLAQTSPAAPPPQVTIPADENSVLASSLKGLNVQNHSGETVGEIEDAIVSGNNIASYILSVGGFLGMGTHYVAVNPSSLAISWSPDSKKWTARVNATKEQLKAATPFKYEGRFAK